MSLGMINFLYFIVFVFFVFFVFFVHLFYLILMFSFFLFIIISFPHFILKTPDDWQHNATCHSNKASIRHRVLYLELQLAQTIRIWWTIICCERIVKQSRLAHTTATVLILKVCVHLHCYVRWQPLGSQ